MPGATQTIQRHRVAIVHTDDPSEAYDFVRGVAHYRPAGGQWRLQSIPFKSRPVVRFPEKRLEKLTFDGVIMMPGHATSLLPLHRAGVRIVDVDESLLGAPKLPFPQVRIDHHHIGRLAAEHLVERGFVRLLFIGVDAPWCRERVAGFLEVARTAEAVHREIYAASWEELRTPRWLREQLLSLSHPVGVFACNDEVGARLIDIAEREKWDVPTRLGVIGVDDRITDCIRVQPPLSSISIERFQAGFEAAKLLDIAFNNPEDTSTHWLRPRRVTERQSTSAYVYGDADVAAALTFIRREACNGITMDHVLHHVNVSRSTLIRRFELLVGRPPGEEIRRVRLEALKRMLAQTNKSLAVLADETGFASVSSLSHCFRTATGLSPNVYRRNFHEATGQ